MGIAVVEVSAVLSAPILVRRSGADSESRQVQVTPGYFQVLDDTNGVILYPTKPNVYPDLNEALLWAANYVPEPPPAEEP